MYICRECGERFEEGTVIKDLVDNDPVYYEEYYVCPRCGSDDWEEAHRCPICDEWTINDDVCEDCEDIIVGALNKLIDDLGTERSDRYDIIYNIGEIYDRKFC